MIRSDRSLPWVCCGTQWPAGYNYCGKCGTSVITADRCVLSFPIGRKGQVSVVANAEVDADAWQLLAKFVAISAEIHAKAHDADATEHEARPANPAASPLSSVVSEERTNAQQENHNDE